MNRRTFLKAAAAAGVVAPIGGVCYAFAESTDLKVERIAVTVPQLPTAFRGLTVAFLTDIHYGPYVTPEYLASVVRTTIMLNPDVIVHGGDYSLREAKYVAPCFEALAKLSAPLGMYGVLGNHDYRHGLDETKAGMRAAKIVELTNRGVWLTRGGERVLMAGVDDFWYGRPDLQKALDGAKPTDACVLLCHNPDFAESIGDRRVGLVLSGHTHGGTTDRAGLRVAGRPESVRSKVRSRTGGSAATTVYVSRGIGMSGLPVRTNCRPEITLLTLS